MNKLRKLFSPSALATTIATGMLLHATVALASYSCLSQCTFDSEMQLGNCEGNVCEEAGEFWCCQDEACAGIVFGQSQCNYSTGNVGWCSCP